MSEIKWKLITAYMQDEQSRAMLNQLTQATFGFDFEAWVRGGYCEGSYLPYSFTDGTRLAANVSANLMEFDLYGKKKQLIQIGTVMTDESHRKQGLARALMEELLRQHTATEGFYLFANDSATGFYEKCGFSVATETVFYSDEWKQRTQPSFMPVRTADMTEEALAARRRHYIEAIRKRAANSALELYNPGLILFYTADMEEVYYSEALDCYVVAELQGDCLYLNDVIARRPVAAAQVLAQLGLPFQRVELGFTPRAEEQELFLTRELRTEDCTLYVRGDFSWLNENRLRFPVLSHA